MNFLKVLVPIVIIKKIYGDKYKKTSSNSPITDEANDLLEDLKDDNS